MRYLLNSPVLTAYGDYRFEGPLPLEAARAFAARGACSAIGHAATARLLSQRLDLAVPPQRGAVRMQPGNEALVLRLLDRLPEGVVLDHRTLDSRAHEFGLLTRMR